MANFKMYAGQFIKIIKELKPIKTGDDILTPGDEYQVLSIDRFTGALSFVGVRGRYQAKYMGQYVAPIDWEDAALE